MKTLLRAPAKINICLKVNNRNDDGYHDIVTIMQRIAIYDTIEVSIIKNKSTTFDKTKQINLTCNFPYVPINEKNLIYKIVRYIYDIHNIKDTINIYLKKMIPIGAGLGGGSSDAASMLLYLNKYYKLKYNLQELSQIAVQFGSDIPFFLYKKESICTGRGEIVKPISQYGSYYVLIATPNVKISTKEIYENYDDRIVTIDEQAIKNEKISNLLYAIKTHNRKMIIDNMFNDLEYVTDKKLPEISIFKKKIMDSKALISMMSGSGSTVFGLFKDMFSAKKCKEMLKNEYKDAFVFVTKPIILTLCQY